jgi:nucleotide-binding universal stress UspA family protein
MKTILVPLDGSDLAARAVPFAATLAARGEASLLLLRAVNTLAAPTESAGRALVDEAQLALDATTAALAADGITASTRVVDRQAESAILEAAADADVNLIVMSTHGRGGLGRFIYGSVADTVLRHAPVPVLTVPPHGLSAWPTAGQVKILVPLDGSELSRLAVGPACDLSDALGGSLLLGSVVTFPSYSMYAEGYVFVDPDPGSGMLAETRRYLEEVAAGLRTDSRQVEVSAIYGSPYFGITSMAREAGAGLIVMASHGRGGMTRALLGSVATATLRQSEVPIVLVRPDEAAEAPASPGPTAPATQEPCPVPPASEAAPTIALSLTADELTLITRVLGERFHNEPVDPRWAEPTRLLLEKLRAVRAAPASPTGPAAVTPASSPRR